MEHMKDLDRALNESDEQVKKLCVDYKELYEKECKIRFRLEDECDLLAVENIRLQNQVNELTLKLSLIPQHSSNGVDDLDNENVVNTSSTTSIIGKVESVTSVVCKVEQKDSITSLPSSPSIMIKNACNEKNVISMSFCDCDQSILCAGADNSIHLFRDIKSISSTTPINSNSSNAGSISNDYLITLQGCELSHWQYKLPTPVTHITSFQNIAACSLFDGSTALVTFPTTISTNMVTNETLVEPLVEIIKDHSKRNIASVFSPDGLLFATASTDKSVHIYRKINDGETKLGWRLDKYVTLYFETTPESIVFAPVTATGAVKGNIANVASEIQPPRVQLVESSTFSSSSVDGSSNSDSSTSNRSQWELIIGVRDSSCLIYFNCQNSTQVAVSLNEKIWDTHPSFAPLQLAVSPNQQYLCVATDKNYHIVYKLGSNERIRMLAKHTCNEYGKPSICWDNTSQYIYSTTEFEFHVYIYSLQTEKVVKKLLGHNGSIRALSYTSTNTIDSNNNNATSDNNSNNNNNSASDNGSSNNSHLFMLGSCSFDKSVIVWV